MDGVFLKNEEPKPVQVHALGAYFNLRPGKATQIVNPFRGTTSPSAGLTDDQVADVILDELTPRGGPKEQQTVRQVRKLTTGEVGELSDEEVLTEAELAELKAKRKRPRKPKAARAPKAVAKKAKGKKK